MKVIVFCANNEDIQLYNKYNNNRLKIKFEKDALNESNIDCVNGYDAIVILTRCVIDDAIATMLAERKIKYIVTRSAGYDHLDLKAIKKYGMHAANVPRYSPNAISEYVCMAILMIIRKMQTQQMMIKQHDFTLNGVCGRELRSLTVGIIGTGRIGFETLKIMSAFTKKIYLNDLYEKAEAREYGTYTDLDSLYKNCDIIIYHCPMTNENFHMVNSKSIAKMKDGVILINPARGGLWNYEDVLNGLKSKKIAGAVFDVYENEKDYLRKISPDNINSVVRELIARNDVIYTAHSAFYTDTAIENMIQSAVDNLLQYCNKGSCDCELID